MVLFATGKFTPIQAVGSLALMPPLLLGFWISGHVIRRSSGRTVRKLVLGVSSASALLLVIRGGAQLLS
jgi:uncharacterized membrane protein YfcA